jgi:hypothetical protein
MTEQAHLFGREVDFYWACDEPECVRLSAAGSVQQHHELGGRVSVEPFDEDEADEVERVGVNVQHIREDLAEFTDHYWPLYKSAGFTSFELAFIAYRTMAEPVEDA